MRDLACTMRRAGSGSQGDGWRQDGKIEELRLLSEIFDGHNDGPVVAALFSRVCVSYCRAGRCIAGWASVSAVIPLWKEMMVQTKNGISGVTCHTSGHTCTYVIYNTTRRYGSLEG